MVRFVVYAVFFLGIGISPIMSQEVTDTTQAFYYNEELGYFLGIPQTQKGVDSLLSISSENRNADLRKGLRAAEHALGLAESLQYKAGLAEANSLLGVNYARLGAHEKSLEHFLLALKIEVERDDKKSIARIYTGIANLYLRQKNYKQAAEYYDRALKELDKIGNKERKVVILSNLGDVYYQQEKYNEALTFLEKALKMLDGPIDNELVKMLAMTNMGNTYTALGSYEKAENYLLEAIEYFDRNGYARGQSAASLYIAKLYQKWNQYGKAMDYARQGLGKAQSIGNKQHIIEGYERLAEIYEDQKKYEQAYNLYKQFKSVQDSLLSSERMTKINEMQVRFDVEQKNRKIELLNKEAALQEARLARQKLWRIFMTIGLGLLAVIIGLLYRYNNQRKQANILLENKNQEIERQNNKLVQLNEEKSEFLGMAAHDLRNPLSGITSVVGLLKEEERMSRKQLKEYIHVIGLASDRMLSLINNLLDVNAIDEGSSHLTFTSVNVQESIDRAIASLEKSIDEKDITVKKQLEMDAPLAIADAEALQQVMENLLSNAIKYSPIGSIVEIISQKKEDRIMVSVIDYGKGIPEDEQQHLFKRFSNISTEPTANEPSTGLGLFIVKKLVDAMNGEVWCESKQGEGATFVMSLPTVQRENNIIVQKEE